MTTRNLYCNILCLVTTCLSSNLAFVFYFVITWLFKKRSSSMSWPRDYRQTCLFSSILLSCDCFKNDRLLRHDHMTIAKPACRLKFRHHVTNSKTIVFYSVNTWFSPNLALFYVIATWLSPNLSVVFSLSSSELSWVEVGRWWGGGGWGGREGGGL